MNNVRPLRDIVLEKIDDPFMRAFVKGAVESIFRHRKEAKEETTDVNKNH